MDETPEEYAWMLQARCRGASPTEFFPSDGLGVESAQHVCEGCPVRTECLEYALVNRIEHGRNTPDERTFGKLAKALEKAGVHI